MSLPLGDGEPVTLRWFDGTSDPLPADTHGVAELAIQRDGVVHHIGQVLWERNEDDSVTMTWVLNEEGRALRDQERERPGLLPQSFPYPGDDDGQ